MSATTNIIPPNEDEAEAAAIPAERKEAKAADNKIKYPFWFGGSAASMAACVTHPLDLKQVRLQTRKPDSPKGFLGTVGRIFRNEGILGFYSGISASVLRQMTYSTVRFGIYEELKHQAGPHPSFPFLVGISSFAGFFGGIAGNPADVLNVRMQYDMSLPPQDRRNYKHVIDGLIRMAKEEGIMSWTRGWIPNSTRAAVQTAGQLASYDTAKRLLLEYTPMSSYGDTLPTQLTASFLAGVTAATVTNPVDVIKTRVMSSKGNISIIQAISTVSKESGILWVFRGWLPSFLRLGPHTVCTFIFLETHRKLYRQFSGQQQAEDK
ncbi:MAG: hypothetical protein FE78DRAFT_76698 [Acidomyces sp. 'richmondensis']|nr:MAG: hypothetical protein FE78DRAFT_76698 [Acidomyces sp. 'richmondensis']